jgi:hypothetical protein
MRYSLWMNGSYVCEAPNEERAITDARSYAAMWDKSVCVIDETTNKIVNTIEPIVSAMTRH